ncbi:MAG: hypothetical protein NXI25_05580 [bacterium]|nr:hypothetical protein [bacterium]
MDAEIGLDKIIDDISPMVGIQYVFEFGDDLRIEKISPPGKYYL